MSEYKNDDNDEEKKRRNTTAASIVAGNSVNESLHILDHKYHKPENYTGNRKLFDSPQAILNAKKRAFQGNRQPKDPYTGKKLVLKRLDAKIKYGDKWTEHLAEADHVVPVERIHGKYKNDPWVTNENIHSATNSDENFKVISRKVNNAKRSRTNEELVDDEAYLREKGIHLSNKGKEKAKADSRKAKAHISKQVTVDKVQNVAKEFHNSGVNAAYTAGAMTAAMSTMDNMLAVIKGEKKPSDAIKDIATDTVTSAAPAYIVSGSMSVIAHSLSSSSSAFVQSLVKANVPGKIVSAVMNTGDVLLKYSKGEITTEECIIGLGEKGVGLTVSGYSMAVGQAVIPIPFVGAAVGTMVGAAISGSMWNTLKQAADNAELAAAEYEQVKVATEIAIAKLNKEREEFEEATNKLFAERAKAINEGFEQFCNASMNNDFDVMVGGLDMIALSFGKDIEIHNFSEFDEMMNDDSKDFNL